MLLEDTSMKYWRFERERVSEHRFTYPDCTRVVKQRSTKSPWQFVLSAVLSYLGVEIHQWCSTGGMGVPNPRDTATIRSAQFVKNINHLDRIYHSTTTDCLAHWAKVLHALFKRILQPIGPGSAIVYIPVHLKRLTESDGRRDEVIGLEMAILLGGGPSQNFNKNFSSDSQKGRTVSV